MQKRKADNALRNSATAQKYVAPNVFLIVGLDLEEQQYVCVGSALKCCH